jgi:2-oxoglutarate ferredoxin oxidoreductase subunit alpha
VHDFVHGHERCLVIEQNRDGQLRSLLILETGVPGEKLVPVLDYGGIPLGTEWVIEQITSVLEVARV